MVEASDGRIKMQSMTDSALAHPSPERERAGRRPSRPTRARAWGLGSSAAMWWPRIACDGVDAGLDGKPHSGYTCVSCDGLGPSRRLGKVQGPVFFGTQGGPVWVATGKEMYR